MLMEEVRIYGLGSFDSGEKPAEVCCESKDSIRAGDA